VRGRRGHAVRNIAVHGDPAVHHAGTAVRHPPHPTASHPAIPAHLCNPLHMIHHPVREARRRRHDQHGAGGDRSAHSDGRQAVVGAHRQADEPDLKVLCGQGKAHSSRDELGGTLRQIPGVFICSKADLEVEWYPVACPEPSSQCPSQTDPPRHTMPCPGPPQRTCRLGEGRMRRHRHHHLRLSDASYGSHIVPGGLDCCED